MATKEEYEQKKQQKEKQRQKEERKRQRMKIGKWCFGIAAVFAVLAAILWAIDNSDIADVEEGDIVSRNGIHRHPHLEIVINGEKRQIPANVGLGGASHNPVHTHERDNIIHLEHSGLVTKDDVKLKRFFEVWGKTFSEECIFEYCNDGNEKVRMFVNGKRNNMFGDYTMKDGDEIVIRYGTSSTPGAGGTSTMTDNLSGTTTHEHATDTPADHTH